MKFHTLRFFIIAFVLTLLGKSMLPSEYYSQDTLIHVPFIRFYQSDAFYQNDYLRQLSIPQTQLTTFYPVMAEIVTLTHIELRTLFMLFHILYLFIFLTLFLFWSYRLTKNMWVGVFATLLVLAHFHIGGAAITSVEAEFVPRGISLVLMLFAVYRLIYKKWISGYLLFCLGFIFHALTGFYFFYFFCIWFVMQKLERSNCNERLRIGTLIFMGIVGLSLFFLRWKISPEWLQILRLRNSYAFLDMWSPKSWLNLLIVILPGYVYWLRHWKKTALTQVLAVIYMGSILLSLIHLLWGIFISTPYIIALQIGRIWLLPTYVSIIAFMSWIISYFNTSTQKFIIGFVLLIVVFGFNLKTRTSSQFILSDWLDIQKWAKIHTKNECVFLTPFYMSGFRMNSERAIIGEYKDGTLSFYSEQFAKEWFKRLQELGDWENKSDADILKLQKKYKFHYLLTSLHQEHSFAKVFNNSQYTLYQIQDCK